MVAKTTNYLAALCILLMSSACSINRASMIGSNAFSGSSLNATRPYPIDISWKSSLRALDSLKISITERSHDDRSAILKGITVKDNSVKLKLESLNPNTTRISIRVGVFGDEIMSREILRRIDNNLEILSQEEYTRMRTNNVY